jgi:hypothetical protein
MAYKKDTYSLETDAEVHWLEMHADSITERADRR